MRWRCTEELVLGGLAGQGGWARSAQSHCGVTADAVWAWLPCADVQYRSVSGAGAGHQGWPNPAGLHLIPKAPYQLPGFLLAAPSSAADAVGFGYSLGEGHDLHSACGGCRIRQHQVRQCGGRGGRALRGLPIHRLPVHGQTARLACWGPTADASDPHRVAVLRSRAGCCAGRRHFPCQAAARWLRRVP